MKKIRTCVVIADGARAKIFINDGPGMGLKAMENGEFEKTSEPSRELGNDRPGRTRDSQSGIRHAVEGTDFHLNEKLHFIGELAKIINIKAANNEFERIILVAPPKILGDMKKKLDKHSTSIMKDSLAKDLTHFKIDELSKHLKEVMVL